MTVADKTDNERLVEVRCIGCRRVLFEATEDSIGTILKKCDRCRQMRRVRLPLTTARKDNTISVDAAAPKFRVA